MSKFKLGGQEEREKARQLVVAQLTQLLARPGVTMPNVVTYMQAQGYPLMREPGLPMQIAHQASGARFELAEVQPNGRPFLDQVSALKRTQEPESKQVKEVEQIKPRGPRLKR
jgi:hypothetical protein